MSINDFEKETRKIINEKLKQIMNDEKTVKEEDLEKLFEKLYSSEVIEKISDPIYQTLIQTAPQMVEEDRLLTQEFESRLQQRWLTAFYNLSSVIKLSEETAMDIIDEYMETKATSINKQDEYQVSIVFDVLLKLYSKAITLSKEILLLLKSGYSDGAMSRWRSLHECNIYFSILSLNYNNRKFTENIVYKYLDYSKIEKYQELMKYQKIDEEFKINSDDYKMIKSDYCDVLKQHGDEFSKPYSWAKELFPKKSRIYFSDLEKMAGIDHLSIYYKQASYHIHASPTGIYNNLGSIKDEKIRQIGYIFGPSNYGLSIPGQLTLISMIQISISLLKIDGNIDRLIRMSIFNKFANNGINEFDNIQNDLKEEIAGD